MLREKLALCTVVLFVLATVEAGFQEVPTQRFQQQEARNEIQKLIDFIQRRLVSHLSPSESESDSELARTGLDSSPYLKRNENDIRLYKNIGQKGMPKGPAGSPDDEQIRLYKRGIRLYRKRGIRLY